MVTRKLISSDSDPSADPFETLHKIVKKDCIDGATFDSRTQADLICMLMTNLDMLENCIFQVKALLKESNHDNFDTVKNEVLAYWKA